MRDMRFLLTVEKKKFIQTVDIDFSLVIQK